MRGGVFHRLSDSTFHLAEPWPQVLFRRSSNFFPDVSDFDGKHGLPQRGTVDKLCSKDATPSPEQIGQLRRYFSRITKSWEEYPEARAALWPVLAQYPSKGQFKYMRN
jgi:hypothetical protein